MNGFEFVGELPRPISFAGCTKFRDEVHILAGFNRGYFSNEHWAVKIVNGEIQSFEQMYPLPESAAYSGATISGKKLYFITGEGNSPYSGNIYKLEPNNHWVRMAALPMALKGSTILNVHGAAYIIGGLSQSEDEKDGQVYSFDEIFNVKLIKKHKSLPMFVSYATGTVVGQRVYLLGGENSSITLNKILVAHIDDSGVLGNFTFYSQNLKISTDTASSILLKNRLFVFGGKQDNKPLNTIQMARVNDFNELEEFKEVGELPITMYGGCLVETTKYVYILGGINNGKFTTAIYRASIENLLSL